MIAAMEFAAASAELYEEKQRCPADDVMTAWTTAEVPGHQFGVDEVITRLAAAARRRRRDDPHGHRPHHPRDGPPARAVADAARRRRPHRRRRGVHPLGHADPQHVPGRHPGRRARRSDRSTPATSWCSCTPRPTGTRRTSTSPSPSTSPATRTTTSRSASAPTSASGASLARLEIRVFFEELLQRVERLPAGAGLHRGDAERVRLRAALGPGRVPDLISPGRA